MSLPDSILPSNLPLASSNNHVDQCLETLDDVVFSAIDGDLSSLHACDPVLKKVLADVAKKMNMTNTEQAVKGGKTWDEVMKAAQSVQSGNLNGLNGQELLLALNAFGELGKLAGSVDKTIRGTIKGRNISAPVGTALKAQVAKNYTIVLK